MSRRPNSNAIVALAAVIGLSLGAAPAFADGKIGVASAVKNDVQGRAGALAVGGSVFANERIRTGDASSAQFMFLDKTVMSMGPKAELVLDKYVFNPNRGGSGQVVVNAVQGSMRFVTGSQNPTNYQIKTPVATLGVRGTVVDLAIWKSQTFVGVVEGLLVVTFFDGTTLTIGKGQYIIISGETKQVSGNGVYNGSDPTRLEMVDWTRINEIDMLNAIIGRNYKPPVAPPVCNTGPYTYYNISPSCYPSNYN